ncbi:hypothetical protein [Lachnoclostridium phytofermentans]|uniref:hypothetical protein n=1 Tax=Lachnoclostridium phytofermentans TaxID=66219 RepID=UPI000496B546|nr:hypothetical protein [Lachnoclostridium phytofermentans]
MDDNPFSNIVSIIRDDNKSQIHAHYRIGSVISADPLRVDVAGAIQDKDSLLANGQITNFQPGEELLLTPIEDEQRYIIICKVVSV